MVYLYEHKGKTTRELGEQFNVDHSTIVRWLQRADEIKAQNREDLSLKLYEFLLLRGEVKWQ